MRRTVLFMPLAWEHIGRWAKEDAKMIAKIYDLIDNASKTPFTGIGKPEPLKANLSGYWSRRITREHRLIYKVEEETIVVFSVYGHY